MVNLNMSLTFNRGEYFNVSCNKNKKKLSAIVRSLTFFFIITVIFSYLNFYRQVYGILRETTE